MPEDELKSAFAPLLSADLVQAVLKRVDNGGEVRITVRPVEIKKARMLQVSRFDGRKTEVKNYDAASFPAYVESLAAVPFRSLSVRLAEEEISVQVSKKGKVILGRRRMPAAAPELSHDRTIVRPLTEGEPDPFLQRIGLMTADGKIKADRQRKFKQINEFIKVVTDTADLAALTPRPLLVVDFGCGHAYLSFALHYYLNCKMGIPTELIGVDRESDSIARNLDKSQGMEGGKIDFVASSIAGFAAPRKPNVVVALHACDTATDEAIAKALEFEADLIFLAPCCHHHIQVQMAQAAPSAGTAAIQKDGILMERLGDLVTDTARAMLLRLAGYQVDVIQFISPDHTAKNLMIRARRASVANRDALLREYRALKEEFRVVPFLESLLSDALRTKLAT